MLLGRAPLEPRSRAVIAIYLIAYAMLVVTHRRGGLAVFFAIESNQSSRLALLAALALFVLSIIACAAFLTWTRRVTA